MIQAITCGFVATSGAGMSISGPMKGDISHVKRRVTVLDLARRHYGRVAFTPPFAPPKGMLTTAAFHVIHMARARISSRSTSGW